MQAHTLTGVATTGFGVLVRHTEIVASFLAHIVLPDGTTAGQFIRPQIAAAYSTGTMPSMLPALPAPSDDEIVDGEIVR